MKYTCPYCNEEVSNYWFRQHLIREHGIDEEVELLLILRNYSKSLSYMKDVPESTLRSYFGRLEERNEILKPNRWDNQFFSYYKHVVYVRNFDDVADLDLFFEKVLPWKLEHPSVVNSKDLAKVEARTPEEEEKIYRHFMLEKNPYYKHDGSMSPWSKDFVGYKGMSDEEKAAAQRKANKSDIKEYRCRLEYWEKRYPDKDEAYAKWKEECNRHAFNLNKCIVKYGEEEGRRIFDERNRKWIATLSSKPIEEIQRINKTKLWRNGNKSSVEFQFLSKLLVSEENRNIYIKEARSIVDCIVGNKIIEFYGDYWHCNPRSYDADFYNRSLHMTAKDCWEKDANRIQKLLDLGYKVKIVWELDYNANEAQVVEECKKFLEEEKK